MTSEAICAAGGASATHGDFAVTSKNTDPDKRTAESTSDNASVLIDVDLHLTAAASDGRIEDRWQTFRTIERDDNKSGRSSKRPGSPIISFQGASVLKIALRTHGIACLKTSLRAAALQLSIVEESCLDHSD